MVKSGASKKQTKASGCANPTGSVSPTIASSTFRALFKDQPTYNAPTKLMIMFLKNHPLFGHFDAFTDIVPLSTLYKCSFSAYRPVDNPQEVYLNLVNDALVILTKEKFLSAINLLIHPSVKFFTPSMADVTTTLYQMGYQKKVKGIGEFKKNQLPAVWQFVCHFIIRSLSGRTGGTYNMGLNPLELVWSIFTGHDVNYGQILWDDFLQYIPKESPRQNPSELNFAQLWPLFISDLHANAKIDMGDDINFFVTKDLKRYNPSSDQTIFGPICRLPVHILSTLGIETPDVSYHVEATEGIEPYLPTPPLPSEALHPEVSSLHGPHSESESESQQRGDSPPVHSQRDIAGMDGDDSNDSWIRYQPSNEAEAKKYAAFRRAFQARKDPQIKQHQLKEQEIQVVAKYWADAINNANTAANILKIQDWMSAMETNIQQTQQIAADQHDHQAPRSPTVAGSQDEEPEIEVSTAPIFGIDDDEPQEVNKPSPSDDDLMMFDEDKESSGSRHSTTKHKDC
ncbi:hypothetical protein Lser_V15G41252 [Lactuca serriola]